MCQFHVDFEPMKFPLTLLSMRLQISLALFHFLTYSSLTRSPLADRHRQKKHTRLKTNPVRPTAKMHLLLLLAGVPSGCGVV